MCWCVSSCSEVAEIVPLRVDVYVMFFVGVLVLLCVGVYVVVRVVVLVSLRVDVCDGSCWCSACCSATSKRWCVCSCSG